MILPDVNLLVRAYDSESAGHDAARAWWDGLMNGTQPVALSWVALLGFIRITTLRQVLLNPLSAAESCAIVREWLARPQVVVLDPGPRHAAVLFSLLEALGTAGNLTTDAHLAALAIEHQVELHSTDADFARFPGLRWTNPLAGS